MSSFQESRGEDVFYGSGVNIQNLESNADSCRSPTDPSSPLPKRIGFLKSRPRRRSGSSDIIDRKKNLRDHPDRYEFCREGSKIAEGGFGKVYKAYDRVNQRDVIVKVIPIRKHKPYHLEAILGLKLSHPRIVELYDVYFTSDVPSPKISRKDIGVTPDADQYGLLLRPIQILHPKPPELKIPRRSEQVLDSPTLISKLEHPRLVAVEGLGRDTLRTSIGLTDYDSTVTGVEDPKLPGKMNIVFEYVPHGDLIDYIIQFYYEGDNPKNVFISEIVVRSMLRQIVDAVKYMHEHNIAHRDLKPDNIVVNIMDNGEIVLKVIDLGMGHLCRETEISRDAHHASGITVQESDRLGSHDYAAPEIYNSKIEFSPFPTDIWAIGIIAYILSHGYHPYNLLYNRHGNRTEIRDTHILKRREYLPHISNDLIDFISWSLETDPMTRATIFDLDQHIFLKS